MAKDVKNGLSNRIVLIVVGVVVAGAVTAVLAFRPSIQNNANAAEVNKRDIRQTRRDSSKADERIERATAKEDKRIDSKVDASIIRQEAAVSAIKDAVSEIKGDIKVIKDRLPPRTP